jgi:hypothetical protein
MLKKLVRTIIVVSIWLLNPEIGLTVEHPAGHGGGSSGSGGRGCSKIGIRNIKPAPLSEVLANSEFSAMVFGANYAEDIEVTVKKIPIDADVVKKDDFYLVKGKLPADIHTTAARGNIKIKSKLPGCSEENGWLLKITN